MSHRLQSITLPTIIAAAISAILPSLAYSAEQAPSPQCNETITLNKCLALFDPAIRQNLESIRSCKAVSKLSCSAKATEPAKPVAAPKLPIYLGADVLDNPYPGLTQSSPGQSIGASFGYTNNDYVEKLVTSKSGSTIDISRSQDVTLNGFSTLVLSSPQNLVGSLDWVPSLWVSASGSWDRPTKSVGEISALKFGPKAEFQLPGEGPDPFISFFDVAPFYQTDFYGTGRAEGLTIGYMPVYPKYFIGSENLSYKPYLVDGFLELRAEATTLNVTQAGFTNLTPRTYEWLGGAARASVFLFPTGSGDWGPYLTDRVALYGTVKSYWDANSGATATLWSAALQYKLTCNTKQPDSHAASGTDTSNCAEGSTSLALEYDYGKDRDTLHQEKMLTAKLNFAY